MKKLTALLLALLLCSTLILPAAAATGGTTTLTFTVEEPDYVYTLTIPQNQTLTDLDDLNSFGMVSVTGTSKNFYNHMVLVEGKCDDKFVGTTYKQKWDASWAMQLKDSEEPTFEAYKFSFTEVDGDGNVTGDAHLYTDTTPVGSVVDDLLVQGYFTYAVPDTYTANVVFSSSVVLNPYALND